MNDPHATETGLNTPTYGSDAVADFLRQAEFEFIALNPGASYRGLHDSLVNYLGDQRPQILMTLHEEHAVAIAHGYAKLSGRPMAVALHSNVGLMHASMAIFNAYVDRVPMLILGAAGPIDASLRRPWIDWIHTTADQPAIVRNYLKWDDTPISIQAALRSMARALQLTLTPPSAPTYVVLDVTAQEQPIEHPPTVPTVRSTDAATIPVAAASLVDRALTALQEASQVVILSGRCGLDDELYRRRISLAERLGARVLTDLKANSSFPTGHPLHVGSPGLFLSTEGIEALADADVVLALDWIDVAGTLRQAPGRVGRQLINATLDPFLINGWSKDHYDWPEADLWLPTTGDNATTQLLESFRDIPGTRSTPRRPRGLPGDSLDAPANGPTISLKYLASCLNQALERAETTFVRLPLGWDSAWSTFDAPSDYLGYDGGGGIGSGPGMTVGAALAVRRSDRLIVSVLGDGDFLMGATAIWTAAKYEAPCLIVIANNRSYFNDEVHQEKVARERGRDVDRKWIGQRIDDPPPDLAGTARSLGAIGIGPVSDPPALRAAIDDAMQQVRAGSVVVVDVLVDAGYSSQAASGLLRGPTAGRPSHDGGLH